MYARQCSYSKEHTKANTDLTTEDLEAYAQMVNHMYRLPVMYIEYSGIYGDVSKVQAVSEHLTETQLFYGGGISSITTSDRDGSYCRYNYRR